MVASRQDQSMKARLVIVSTLIVAGLLVVFVWKRINGQPVAVAVATEHAPASPIETTSVALDASTPIRTRTNDQRAIAVMPAAPQAELSATVDSNTEPATDATLVVRCRAKPSGRPLEGVRVIVSTNDTRFS